jgi:5-methylcytosine-specific restriction endonuclease McrA
MADKKEQSQQKLDDVVAKARLDSEKRGHGYREQALKMYPWICGRCSREFTRLNLQELTVHHRNHDHDYNPSDGSNWELLCMYCHDNEHQRQTEALANKGIALNGAKAPSAKFNPFADLKSMMDKDNEK